MYITLYKTPAGKPPRYYTIHNRQGNLFTPYSLTLVWGRAVTGGTERLLILETRSEFDARVRGILRRRLREGYQVLYSYYRSDEHAFVRAPDADGRSHHDGRKGGTRHGDHPAPGAGVELA